MNTPAVAIMQLRKYSPENNTHSHDFYQWILPIQGILELETNKKEGCVTKDYAAFIQPNEVHCFAGQGENEFLVLDVDINHRWMNTMIIPTFWKITPELQHFLQFVKSYLFMGKANEELRKTLIQDFLLKLLEQHFFAPFDKKTMRAKEWIDVHFSAPIDIKKISEISCLSSSQLQRRFRQAFGQSVGEYWRSVRLKQAQFLLKTNSTTIEQIAFRVGYENLSSFSRSFSEYYGISPAQYRCDSRSKKVASPS